MRFKGDSGVDSSLRFSCKKTLFGIDQTERLIVTIEDYVVLYIL
jgi:hypothetical protein